MNERITPLPWKLIGRHIYSAQFSNYEIEAICRVHGDNDYNAPYIVHACNNYPKLEALNMELENSVKVQKQFGVEISEQCFKRDMTIKMYKGYSLNEKELSHIHPDDIHDYQETQRINKEASQGIFLALTQRCDELKASQALCAELVDALEEAIAFRYSELSGTSLLEPKQSQWETLIAKAKGGVNG